MKLSPTARLVLLVLEREGSGDIQIARSELARRTGACAASVSRAMNELVGAGLVERVKQGGGRIEAVWRLSPTGTLQ